MRTGWDLGVLKKILLPPACRHKDWNESVSAVNIVALMPCTFMIAVVPCWAICLQTEWCAVVISNLHSRAFPD